MTTTLETRQTEASSRLPRVTLATGVFLLVISIGAVLRFSWLGALALNSEEARQALAAWEIWQPVELALPGAPPSPAYVSLTAIVFGFIGDSDAMARFAPALFGLVTVALPWLWRSRLGTAGVLAVSTLLAVSPTLTLTSATAAGDSMAVAATLLIFIAWMRFREESSERWLLLAIGALGFGLTTSPLFYSAMVTLLAAWLLQRAIAFSDAEVRSGDGAGISSSDQRQLIVVFIATFLLTATLILWRPGGLGDAAGQFGLWLMQFDLTAGLQPLALPLLALGRYELVIITLGAAAIIWASWRGIPLPLFLVYWFAAVLLLILLQQGVLANVLLLVVPSYFLIGLWVNHATNQDAGVMRWTLAPTLILLGVIAYFNGARYLRVMVNEPQQLSFLFFVFLALAAMVVAINLVRSWDHAAAYQAALIGFLFLFSVYGWGTARWMLTEGGNDPREYWVQEGGDDDLRLLVDMLTEVSWQSSGMGHSIDVLAAVDTPALRWYLRDFSDVVFGETVPPGVTHGAIISAVDDDPPALGEDYMGTDLGLVHTGGSSPFSVTISDTLRWWIFHEHPATISGERIILWVRNDVLQ